MPRPCHILIIGDMPSEMALLRESFYDAHWNAIVEEVFSEDAHGYAAVDGDSDMARPDILLSDIHHRGESCMDVLARIRDVSCWSQQPLIVCTTRRLSHSAMYECLGLGVIEVVIKPRTYAGIVAMIATIKAHLTGTGDLSPAGAWIGGRQESAPRQGR